jgi:hypothetical protein
MPATPSLSYGGLLKWESVKLQLQQRKLTSMAFEKICCEEQNDVHLCTYISASNNSKGFFQA